MELLSPKGAIFNSERTERYVLWRIWNVNKRKVLFIGLNPSKANSETDDATTKRLMAHATRFGFGGFFLMNCIPSIATRPKDLRTYGNWPQNLFWLDKVEPLCAEIVFMWGKDPRITQLARDAYFKKRFPNAKQMGSNQDGSPKHPLYLPYTVKLVPIAKSAY